ARRLLRSKKGAHSGRYSVWGTSKRSHGGRVKITVTSCPARASAVPSSCVERCPPPEYADHGEKLQVKTTRTRSSSQGSVEWALSRNAVHERQHEIRGMLPGSRRFHHSAALRTQRAGVARVGEQAPQSLLQGFWSIGFYQKASALVLNRVGNAAGASSHGRLATRVRFAKHQAEALDAGVLFASRHDERIAGVISHHYLAIVELPQEKHALGDSELPAQLLQRIAFRAASDDCVLHVGNSASERRQGLEHRVDALAPNQSRRGQEQRTRADAVAGAPTGQALKLGRAQSEALEIRTVEDHLHFGGIDTPRGQQGCGVVADRKKTIDIGQHALSMSHVCPPQQAFFGRNAQKLLPMGRAEHAIQKRPPTGDSSGSPAVPLRQKGCAIAAPFADQRQKGQQRIAHGIRRHEHSVHGVLEVAIDLLTACVDRKSTRLNSIHVKISY